MLTKKSTKRACQVILIVLAIMVCPVIIGMTYPWFPIPKEGAKP